MRYTLGNVWKLPLAKLDQLVTSKPKCLKGVFKEMVTLHIGKQSTIPILVNIFNKQLNTHGESSNNELSQHFRNWVCICQRKASPFFLH